MDPSIRKGIQKRYDWIRRNPGGAGDYIRLTKSDREKVDSLFTANRRLKANEVASLVEKLTEERLSRRRVTGTSARANALANMRAQLGHSEQYRDKGVVKNVAKMTKAQLRIATASDTAGLITLARIQEEGNPFFYH